jgi:hypothetical protein
MGNANYCQILIRDEIAYKWNLKNEWFLATKKNGKILWYYLHYLKPTHALILKHTFTSTFIKTLKLVKNVL